jgi:hypothetical protein
MTTDPAFPGSERVSVWNQTCGGASGHATGEPRVPGACQVVPVKPWHLTDGHVIRLSSGQGWWPGQPYAVSERNQAAKAEVRHVWREVLHVYREPADLEGVYGPWSLSCTQPGCHAVLHGSAWQQGRGATPAHEHQADAPPGHKAMAAELALLADKTWEDSESSMLVRLLLHEFSDPGEIQDVLVILNRNDLVEAQSLPAVGRESAWGGGQAYPPDVLDLLISAAGELWDSTGGHDPHDVLSEAQRKALDLAAELHQAEAAAAFAGEEG